MTLFDINAAIGHWPFRHVPNEQPAELRALLTAKGVSGAAVVNTHGLFYLDCHDANRELAEAIGDHLDFFVGVATLNPAYPGWERDLSVCRERLGLRALRLAPQYHGYRLGGPESVAIARAAAELAMPLLVPHRVVDTRGRHHLDVEETVGLAELAALWESVPEATVIMTEVDYYGAKDLLREDGSLRYPNLYLDLSRMYESLYGLPPDLAAERLLFGTGAPLKHITPALLKLQLAEVDEAARRRIASENARALLGLGS
ncbi:MAG: amidohydrolase family protein [Armatimonadota bacterium]